MADVMKNERVRTALLIAIAIEGAIGAWSAEEYEGEDAHLDNVTLYDYPWYGPSNELLEFCGKYGVDLTEQWSGQKKFDKMAQEAVMSVW